MLMFSCTQANEVPDLKTLEVDSPASLLHISCINIHILVLILFIFINSNIIYNELNNSLITDRALNTVEYVLET